MREVGKPLRIGVIVDGGSLAAWQAEALRRLGPDVVLTFYDCVNMQARPRQVRHYPYYLLNLLSLKTPVNRQQPLAGDARRHAFQCLHEGMWQRLPADLIERFEADGVELIVKFGMGLLRVPDDLALPILSYHHGDPRRFRGRPAGFYELLSGGDVVGQIVQRLSNRLDAGAVLAYAESRIQPHSYRGTMQAAYRLSPLLLGPAIRNALSGAELDISAEGKVTRLPSTFLVARFAAQRAGALARRLLYGGVAEKSWRVAVAPAVRAFPVEGDFPDPRTWDQLPVPPGYRFLADPFFHPRDGTILAEALNGRSGLGEILALDGDNHRALLGGGHFSYPAAFEEGGRLHLLPEMSDQEPQRLFRLEGGGVEPGALLDLPDGARLLDPTPVSWQGRHYLFANRAEEGPAVLRLWSAESLAGRFTEHPDSPVCLSPAGGRMGGLLFERDGKLYRLGQDGRRDYGDGLLLFRVEELTPERYREQLVREIRCPQGLKGPHTLNLQGGRLLFDYYRDRLAPLAGVRRVRARLARR